MAPGPPRPPSRPGHPGLAQASAPFAGALSGTRSPGDLQPDPRQALHRAPRHRPHRAALGRQPQPGTQASPAPGHLACWHHQAHTGSAAWPTDPPRRHRPETTPGARATPCGTCEPDTTTFGPRSDCRPSASFLGPCTGSRSPGTMTSHAQAVITTPSKADHTEPPCYQAKSESPVSTRGSSTSARGHHTRTPQ